MTYKAYETLEEIKIELERLETVQYGGDSAVILLKIRAVFPSFVPVSEDEIFYRARQLNIPYTRENK